MKSTSTPRCTTRYAASAAPRLAPPSYFARAGCVGTRHRFSFGAGIGSKSAEGRKTQRAGSRRPHSFLSHTAGPASAVLANSLRGWSVLTRTGSYVKICPPRPYRSLRDSSARNEPKMRSQMISTPA